jgi:acetylornithine deacetylase/succinyl-diaminopimelate desuccinylase-like protein
MNMAHKTDEYCIVDKIDEAAQVYETLAQRWCGL